MIKVNINPDYLDKSDTGDGGIRRVVEAMLKYLPEYDIQHVRNKEECHIVINHGAMLTHEPGKPSINVNHGLYWSRQPWEAGYQQVNAQVVESMCRAVAHTAPSEWVSRAIRRGGLFYPEVIYHGVDSKDFKPQKQFEKIVLWNKARADYVSNPNDMQQAAMLLPDIQFWSTLGRPDTNVKILGISNYGGMKSILQKAGVYLCTARETFGIGTLEAMASGVPVAGWDWGGQSEIIKQGETGYLAKPGDFKELAECIVKCFEERERLSTNCVNDVRLRWQWKPRIKQYAELIRSVYHDTYEVERKKVSVIITAHYEDRYLPYAIESVQRQTLEDFECVVVDDGQSAATKAIVEDYASRDARIRYMATPENLGLPGARNFGSKRVTGKFVRFLDADDFMAPNALALEANALESDPSIHITYGHLEMVREDGTRIEQNGSPIRGDWPPVQFSWVEQMAHLNQLPSCVMMRREVLEKSGGYRVRMKRQEDADFWCRVTSLGFRAYKCTQAVTYFHRQREDSKGSLEWRNEGQEPDWTAWFPWRVGASDYRSAIGILRRTNGEHPHPYLVPFTAEGNCPNRDFWQVHDYAYPLVSVIVTVGPGHEAYLIDALDSVLAQSYPDWECIVVNDTGHGMSKNILGAPWAKVVSTKGNFGAAAARNEGYKYTRGRFIVYLDADDYWMPWFLEVMMAHAEKNEGIIFSDFVMDDGKEKKIYRQPDFTSAHVALKMSYSGSSVLIPRAAMEAVMKNQNGWDVNIPGLEDWDFQIAMHAAGFCAYHVPEPLFVYRTETSTKREKDYAKIDSILEYLNEKWPEYRQGVKAMCGCTQTKPVTTKPQSFMSSSGDFKVTEGNLDKEIPTQMVEVEYSGPNEQTFTLKSIVDRSVFYRFNNTDLRIRSVFLADAERLIGMTDRFGRPEWKMIGNTSSMDERNPIAIVGELAAA